LSVSGFWSLATLKTPPTLYKVGGVFGIYQTLTKRRFFVNFFSCAKYGATPLGCQRAHLRISRAEQLEQKNKGGK
jgi:hypothetical protein